MNVFIGSAAAVASSSTVLNAQQPGVDDPIFAAIEEHQQACTALDEHLHLHTRLENELPKEKRRTFWIFGEGFHTFAGDDARWLDCETRLAELHEGVDAAIDGLLDASPSTLKGAAALMKHMAEYEQGEEWPTYEIDGRPQTFDHLIHSRLAELLSTIAA